MIRFIEYNTELIIVLAAGVGTFLTLLAFLLPYFQSDPVANRLKSAAKRRQELRSLQLEVVQRKSRLRRSRPSIIREFVERLHLRDLFAGPDLKIKLIQANWRDPNAVAVFAAARALLPIAFGGLAALILFGSETLSWKPQLKMLAVGVATVAGVYLPNLLMQNAIAKRQAAFTSSFPDALDLLLICVESGLSIEAAFARVANETGNSAPELAEELELTTAELAYLPDRRSALENLTLRTGLPAVKAVCTTLIQAEKYGTPLTQALRTAAQENRDRRMAIAEKKAHALPAMLTGPMIIFFLPVLFLVILGPVVIRITQ